ncbi:hypothetical protein I4F81_007646 [Pyropia yezoensis]|uniref:Uncharacterized protein n=1 Tax=Pyropia yezoensis TaxID=2788 RepID=A0ACC3C496_PYRYE|nr:hypothetical protein I4F81_007646 [Neopyropia yezoensis]
MAAVGGGGPLSGASPGVLAELASAAALAADAARSLRPPPDVTALARAAVAETASAATVWARLALRLATPAAAAAVAGVRAAAPGVRAGAAAAGTRLLAQPPRVLAAQAAAAAAVLAATAVEARTGAGRRAGRWVVATVEAARAAYGRRMVALRAQSRAVAAVAPHAEWLTLAAEEGGFVALGSIFFITPRPLTYLGTLAVGFLFPAYLSAAAVSAAPAGAVGGGALAADARRRQRRWLTYWTALAALDGLLLGPAGGVADWLPLWYHVRLGVLLWLQLPCLGGATTVCGLVVGWVAAVVGAVGGVARWVDRRWGGGRGGGETTPRKRKRT